jgi:hypothetical protein
MNKPPTIKKARDVLAKSTLCVWKKNEKMELINATQLKMSPAVNWLVTEIERNIG